MRLSLKKIFADGFGAGVLLYAIIFVLLFADSLVAHNTLPGGFFAWFCFVYTFFPWTLVAMIPLWLLGGRLSRYVYLPVVFFAIVVVSIEWFVRIKFHMLLLGDWVGIVMGSSPAEIKWFVGNYFGLKFILCLLCLVAAGWFFGLIIWRAKNVKVSRLTVVAAMFSMCVYVYATSLPSLSLTLKVRSGLTMVRAAMDSIRSYSEYRLLAQMKMKPELPPEVNLVENEPYGMIGVIVLGESATRNHMGIYGYERNTTPCMQDRKSQLICFSDVVTPMPETAEAMRYIFTTGTMENHSDFRYTMAQVFRKAGCEVSLFSNQERWGEWDGDESFDFAGCEPMCFMGETDATNRYDEILLSYLRDSIAQPSTNRVVFLHLKGSHWPLGERYPHEGAPFLQDTAYDGTINQYDNTIWYTDRVLGEVIRILEETKKPCWLMYLSDHGETPSSGGWRMASDNDLWEVPLVFWVSDEFRKQYSRRVAELDGAKDISLQSDQLFYGILKFAGLSNLNVDAKDIFTDPAFVPRRERLIQNGQGVYHAQ